MKHRFFKYLMLGLVAFFTCYLVSYALVVQRILSPCGPELDASGYGTGVVEVKAVANVRSPLGSLLFSPALFVDRSYIRPRYWSDFKVIDLPRGKSRIVYAIDEPRP